MKYNIVAVDPICTNLFRPVNQPKIDKFGFIEQDILELSSCYHAEVLKEDEEVNEAMGKGDWAGFKLLTNVRQKPIPDNYEYVGGMSTVFGHTTIVVMNIADRMVVFAESRNKRDKQKMLDEIALKYPSVYFFEE